MKIYFIGQKGIPALFGGIERHTEELAIRLVRAGHKVFVYTRPYYTSRELKEYKGVNLESIPSIKTKHLDAITHTFLACIDVIRRDADIIHFHSIGPSSLIWLIKVFKPRVPIIATFHSKCYLHKKWGPLAQAYLKFGERTACKNASKTITVSASLTQYVKEKYNVLTQYIPSGISLQEIVTANEIKKWDLMGNDYILSVSRLVGHKGLHFLIEAYKNIKTDKKLVIAGEGVFTDDYVQKLKSMASNNPNIIFVGNQTGNSLQELYSNAYLFVQPSESEGLSIALLEAMSYGNAVLVSDIPENREIVGKDGLTFTSGNVKSLEMGLLYLLNNPFLIKKIGSLNRSRVNELYNWDRIVGDIIKLYKEAIEEKSKLKSMSLIKKFINLF